MATTALSSNAERWLDEVILSASVQDVGGATIVESFTLPAGFGDAAIMSVHATVSGVATVPGAGTVARGVNVLVLAPDAASVVDTVGTGEWYASGGALAAFDRFDAMVDPDALTLFRQGELLTLRSPEMDVNAAPTGDLRVLVKVARVRPIESPARGPIRLVR